MDAKKAKVTKITKMDKLDSYNNTSFVIEFENGDKGFYTSKNPDQKKFIIGNVADYTIEQKQGSKGSYFKITVPQDAPTFKGGGFGKAPVDPKVSMISYAGSYTKDLVVAGKVQMADFEKEFNKIYSLFISKL